jgi:hypothetical protein
MTATLRVATYNIHKGVQGVGFTRRLEIHNIGHAVEQLDADIVCLQEVRKLHRREERYFTPLARTSPGGISDARGLRIGLPDQRHHQARRARKCLVVALARDLARA